MGRTGKRSGLWRSAQGNAARRMGAAYDSFQRGKDRLEERVEKARYSFEKGRDHLGDRVEKARYSFERGRDHLGERMVKARCSFEKRKYRLEERVEKARYCLEKEVKKASCKGVTTGMQPAHIPRKEKLEGPRASTGSRQASDEVMPMFPPNYKDESRLRKQVNDNYQDGKRGPTFYFQGETRIGEPPQRETYCWTVFEACYPKILKLPPNGQYGIMEPTFEGHTIQIVGAPRLAEVLEVGITSTAGGRKEIRGTVKVLCEEVDLLFFKRLVDPQIVHDKGLLELTRPRVGLTVCSPLEIIAAIDVGTDGRLDMAETVNMIVHWEEHVGEYDKVKQMTRHSSGSGSLLHVSYVVYKKAVLAFIEITFQPLCPVEICGRIKAHNNRFPLWESVLFCKERSHGKRFRVEHGEQQLPLLRSVATVPIFSSPPELRKEYMNVSDRYDEAELQDGCLQIYFNLANFPDQGTIALGSLKFLTKKYGDCASRIYSQYGVMQVKVSFVSSGALGDLLTHQGRRES